MAKPKTKPQAKPVKAETKRRARPTGAAFAAIAANVEAEIRERVAVEGEAPQAAAQAESVQTETKLVQLRLRPGTIEKVYDLAKWLESPNRTAAVVTAIGIAHAVVSRMKEKGAVYSETPGGVRDRFIIPDLRV